MKQSHKTTTDPVAEHFAGRLKENFHKNIKSLILFGSRAREEHHEGSDYDFLIVLEKKEKSHLDKIRSIEVEILDKFDSLAGSIVCDKKEWRKMKKYPIGRNILKEGIYL